MGVNITIQQNLIYYVFERTTIKQKHYPGKYINGKAILHDYITVKAYLFICIYAQSSRHRLKPAPPSFEMQIIKKCSPTHTPYSIKVNFTAQVTQISNYEAHVNNLNVKYRAGSHAHHSYPALQLRQSWIHLCSLFLRRIFQFPKEVGTFRNCRCRRLSWHT